MGVVYSSGKEETLLKLFPKVGKTVGSDWKTLITLGRNCRIHRYVGRVFSSMQHMMSCFSSKLIPLAGRRCWCPFFWVPANMNWSFVTKGQNKADPPRSTIKWGDVGNWTGGGKINELFASQYPNNYPSPPRGERCQPRNDLVLWSDAQCCSSKGSQKKPWLTVAEMKMSPPGQQSDQELHAINCLWDTQVYALLSAHDKNLTFSPCLIKPNTALSLWLVQISTQHWRWRVWYSWKHGNSDTTIVTLFFHGR